jgi:hypothetical protein
VDFAPHTDEDVRAMVETIGVGSIDELFSSIPASLRLTEPLALPPGRSELEVLDEVRALAARNRSADDLVCFAGRGAYDHFIPSVVWALAGRSEFTTSYTPYQPELSQGVLQALFEFQSMMCAITGLEVSNASLYDGATALVEAARMSQTPDRSRVVVSGGVDAPNVCGRSGVRRRRAGGTRGRRRHPGRSRRRRRGGRRAAPERPRPPRGRRRVVGASTRGRSANDPGVRSDVARDPGAPG